MNFTFKLMIVVQEFYKPLALSIGRTTRLVYLLTNCHHLTENRECLCMLLTQNSQLKPGPQAAWKLCLWEVSRIKEVLRVGSHAGTVLLLQKGDKPGLLVSMVRTQ